MTILERLQALRHLMKKEAIDCYLISTTDPHHNEYVPPCWQWRAWISGFKGSNGHVCITQDQALLWTDSRYFIEAEKVLQGTSFQLMKIGAEGVPSQELWLKQQNQALCVGLDAKQWNLEAFERLQQALPNARWKILDENLLHSLWTDRPAIPATPVILLTDELTGRSVSDKLEELRQHMKKHAVQFHVISHLDAIAWLLNIRAQDIQYNPLCISYVVVGQESVEWFIQHDSVSHELQTWCARQGVILKAYGEIEKGLQALEGKVWVDSKRTSVFIAQALVQCTVFKHVSSIELSKACKNAIEQQGMREAHCQDGVAMVSFIAWLKQHGLGQTETALALQLEKFRQNSKEYKGPSFQTISGVGANAAIVHYAAEPGHDATLEEKSLYLLDSGGQYPYGTTDITRVFHLGQPTSVMKEHYTRVLKGHIALARIIFPQGTAGSALDVLARAALWEAGLDFGHGTGHGVGCYLCVHEGPQGISSRNHEPLKVGMVLSNEPGYYAAGQYGIRIENLMLVIPHPIHQDFLCFETLTLCPYEQELIIPALLSPEELAWVNDYHAQVRKTLSTHIIDKKLLADITRFTAPLKV
jgi:Xaa-Pro aminopeptidase